jgi:hypothetical protein
MTAVELGTHFEFHNRNLCIHCVKTIIPHFYFKRTFNESIVLLLFLANLILVQVIFNTEGIQSTHI